MSMIYIAFAVYTLALMRLTRLINSDTILDPVRVVIGRRGRDVTPGTDGLPKTSEAERRRWLVLEDFLQCPWCVGMWLCLLTAWIPLVVFGVVYWWAWWIPVALAVSMIIGMAAPLYNDHIEIESD